VKRNILTVPVRKVHGSSIEAVQDLVAVEEPLEIRIGDKPISITMRTPGHDVELAAGFLFGEGILAGASDLQGIEGNGANVVTVLLRAGVDVDHARLERNFYTTSSCGVCGKASIEAVHATGCMMLERDGFKALKAKDASEALTMLEQGERPDLIILDVMMPGMDGVDLCRTIRNRPATTEIPILILSARSDVEAVMRGMDAGATDYLPKPILNHDLTAKVRTMLSMDAVLEE